MANLNKVMLIGRLTRDPEVRTFSNGGKVAKLGFAVNNKRRNATSGEWEDEPVFLDVDAFNRGEMGKLADRVEQYLHKGMQIFIEGHLKLDQWTTQDGQKRSKLAVVMENFQFLEPRQEGAGEGGSHSPRASGGPPQRRPAPPRETHAGGHDEPPGDLEPQQGRDEDIPF